MTEEEERFALTLARAREILERQVAGTPVDQVDARIAWLRSTGQTVRAQNVLRARIKAFGEPIGLQSHGNEPKKGSS